MTDENNTEHSDNIILQLSGKYTQKLNNIHFKRGYFEY